jgi:hypothetical protein
MSAVKSGSEVRRRTEAAEMPGDLYSSALALHMLGDSAEGIAGRVLGVCVEESWVMKCSGELLPVVLVA